MLIETPSKPPFVYGLTHQGLVRERNEDYWSHVPGHGFICLADGMGGHRAGDVAAEQAVKYSCDLVRNLLQNPNEQWDSPDAWISIMRYVFKETNKNVLRLAQSRSDWKGMGTTLCCLFFHGQQLYHGHIGDSRVYHWRKGSLQCLTRDHTLVRQRIEGGALDENSAKTSSERHILTQAIGVDALIDPSIDVMAFEEGDTFLICSDGLTEHLDDEELASVLANAECVEDAAHQLIETANSCGGTDNVTVVLAQAERTTCTSVSI